MERRIGILLLTRTIIRLVEFAVHVISCADQTQMGEGLREIAQLLAIQTQFFREESQMIGITERLFEIEPRQLHVSGPRQAFDIPERAHRKSSFPARKTRGRPFYHVV